MTTASIERINFQHKSVLATKLVAFIKESMDVLKSTRPTDTKQELTELRIKNSTKQLQKIFVPKLVKLIKDELNIELEVAFVLNKTYLNGACYTEFKKFSDLASGDYDSVEVGMDLFSGLKNSIDEQSPAEPFDPEYFKKLSSDVDLSIGKFTSELKECRVYLYLYPTNFITEEWVDTRIISPVTAEELASVILHEFGHVMTLLEHLGDIYFRSDVMQNSIKYLSTSNDTHALNTAVSDLETHANQDQNISKFYKIVNSLKIAIETVASIVSIIWLTCVPFDFIVPALWRLNSAGKYGNINLKFQKTSDTVVTVGNESFIERIADEFVSRHGLGEALTSAMTKVNLYYSLGHTKDSFSDAVKNVGVLSTLCLSFNLITDILSPLYDNGYSSYDSDWLRIEHVLLNNMVVFKDPTLDDKTRTYFIQQTKTIMDLINSYKNRKSFKLKQLLWNTIFRILSSYSLKDSLSTANLAHDYDTLQLITNGLIKNKLFYHSARLTNILNKK